MITDYYMKQYAIDITDPEMRLLQISECLRKKDD